MISTKVHLVNSVGFAKDVKVGFSWTMLFFGFFVPLFRADWLQFFVSLFLSAFTGGLSWLIYPFFYNRFYINSLLSHGFGPVSQVDQHLLIEHNFIIPHR